MYFPQLFHCMVLYMYVKNVWQLKQYMLFWGVFLVQIIEKDRSRQLCKYKEYLFILT